MREALSRLSAIATQIMEIYGKNYQIQQDDLWVLAKLTEELGELNSAWLSANGRGRDRGLTPEQLSQAVEDEAADLFGFLLYFAARNNIDLEAALERKWGRWLSTSPQDAASEGEEP